MRITGQAVSPASRIADFASLGVSVQIAGMNRPQPLPVLAAAAILAWIAWRAAALDPDLGFAALIGGFAGYALYHASFGFTSGWRRIITEGRGAGLRAQFLLIGLTALVSFPLIGWFGAGSFTFPFGVGVAVGAFLFGMGMQLGGGCGSGTLYTVGGGSTRMVITLAFFIAGSMLGRAHAPWWESLPRFRPYSLVTELGTLPAMAVMGLILTALYLWTIRYERARHGEMEPPRPAGSLLRGPWPPATGAVALALVGIATFLVLNRPWGITSAFAIWGAKIVHGLGYPIDEVAFWNISPAVIARPVLADSTSVMDFGIMAGALAAAGLAGRFRPVWRLSRSEVATAVVGGLLMGYGARLAYGCNIGAYLGGLVSGSAHGWVWAAFGFAGSSAVAWVRRPKAAAVA